MVEKDIQVNPIIYHCPNCRTEITTDMLQLHTQKRWKEKIYKVVYDYHEWAWYEGKCPQCGKELTIDQHGINGQFEKI